MVSCERADALDTDFAESNFWLVTMKLDTLDEAVRAALLETGHERRLSAGQKGMHHLPMYRDCPRAELTHAKALEAQIVNLPSSAVLGMDRNA
jgi:perosamine synthetase